MTQHTVCPSCHSGAWFYTGYGDRQIGYCPVCGHEEHPPPRKTDDGD